MAPRRGSPGTRVAVLVPAGPCQSLPPPRVPRHPGFLRSRGAGPCGAATARGTAWVSLRCTGGQSRAHPSRGVCGGLGRSAGLAQPAPACVDGSPETAPVNGVVSSPPPPALASLRRATLPRFSLGGCPPARPPELQPSAPAPGLIARLGWTVRASSSRPGDAGSGASRPERPRSLGLEGKRLANF